MTTIDLTNDERRAVIDTLMGEVEQLREIEEHEGIDTAADLLDAAIAKIEEGTPR